MKNRLTARLKDGTAVLKDWSIMGQQQAREKLCKLEEMIEAGLLREDVKEPVKGSSADKEEQPAAGQDNQSEKPAAGAKRNVRNAAKTKSAANAG